MSGVASGTSTTAVGGVEQRGVGGARLLVDKCRLVAQSSFMVASTEVGRSKVEASVSTLKMDRWKEVAAASVAYACMTTDSAPDRCVP